MVSLTKIEILKFINKILHFKLLQKVRLRKEWNGVQFRVENVFLRKLNLKNLESKTFKYEILRRGEIGVQFRS